MKRILFIVCLFLCNNGFAQRNDNVWLIGYHYCGAGCPIPALDFTYGYPDTPGVFTPFDMFETDASICDSTGLLQFYTNGVFVANKNNLLLDSSVDFNYDSIMPQMGITDYMSFLQCAIILPYPGHPNQYYLFHLSGRTANNFNIIQPFRLAYSTVDMNQNGGLGKMVLKNQEVFADTLLYATMQAVKHANGRDWWIVVHEYNSNGFYAALLTEDSITTVVHSFAGPRITKGIGVGQSMFSPDGSKFAIANRDSNLLYLYHFNRCFGTFSNDTLIRHTYNMSGYNFAGCAFSPNSRYLYADDHNSLYQYDTDTADVIASEQLIATYDGFLDPFQTFFYRFCNGPDGKLYINTWGSAQHLHVINQPDLRGLNCNFVQHQQKIMNYSGGLPDFPNYRLGSLGQNYCDSLIASVEEVPDHSQSIAFPNPSENIFNFKLPIVGDRIETTTITNVFGEFVYKSEHEKVIDLTNLKSGVYFYFIKTESGNFYQGKLIKQCAECQ